MTRVCICFEIYVTGACFLYIQAQVLFWDLNSQGWDTESFIFNTNGMLA